MPVSGGLVFDLFTVVAFIDAHHTVSCTAIRPSSWAAGTELPEPQLRSATDYSRVTASQEMRGRMSSWSLARPLSARSIPRDEESMLLAQELEAARGLDW